MSPSRPVVRAIALFVLVLSVSVLSHGGALALTPACGNILSSVIVDDAGWGSGTGTTFLTAWEQIALLSLSNCRGSFYDLPSQSFLLFLYSVVVTDV